MGLNFKELIVKKETSIKDLANKTLAIDTMNLLYQFIPTCKVGSSIQGLFLLLALGEC